MAAKSVADIRSRFRTQLVKMQQLADKASQASRLTAQRQWMLPDKNGWTGDLFDLTGLEKPFDRSENWKDFKKALDPKNPGVVGDLQVSQLQGDWLAAQERAFRARHMTRCRAEQHSAARLYGHGHALGLYKKSILGYLQGIVGNAKDNVRKDPQA